MSPKTKRNLVLGVATAASVSLGLVASPAKALGLLDNTSGGTDQPGAGTPLGPNKAFSLNFSTNTYSASYLRLTTNFAAPNLGANSFLLRIYEVPSLSTSNPTTGTLKFTNTFNFNATTLNDANYSFQFNNTLVANKNYAFVFTDPSSFGLTQNTGGVFDVTTPFSAITYNPGPPSTGSAFRSNSAGTVWSISNAPYFYLNEVPGPLPILGAGSAFAWSRRLRKRVNSARSQRLPLSHDNI